VSAWRQIAAISDILNGTLPLNKQTDRQTDGQTNEQTNKKRKQPTTPIKHEGLLEVVFDHGSALIPA